MREPRAECQETLTEHLYHLSNSSRQRARLLAGEVGNRIHISMSRARAGGQRAAEHVVAGVALRISRRLFRLAEKIERRAKLLQKLR